MAISFPSQLTVEPICRAAGVIQLPGSKSISNRALLIAAMADGVTRLEGLLKADDTDRMIESLVALGVNVQRDAERSDVAVVHGCRGCFPVKRASLFIGNAGTAARTLTAALAFAGGEYSLDGIERMRSRPIGDLVDALRRLGADIEYKGQQGYPPLLFHRAQAKESAVSVRGNVSSQFLTALLLQAPYIAGQDGLTIRIEGELISRPYIDMTIRMMRDFGIEVHEAQDSFVVMPGCYQAKECYWVEGDASGASYFMALGALAQGPVRVEGVGVGSLQGDVHFADALEVMGAHVIRGQNFIEVSNPSGSLLSGIALDCTKIPDAAMSYIPMIFRTRGAIRLTGIASWRVKETDRIAAMATEIAKFGARVSQGADWIEVDATGVVPCSATVDTYDDHRMAMCMALVSTAGVAVTINDPKCTAKTFPTFFHELSKLRD